MTHYIPPAFSIVPWNEKMINSGAERSWVGNKIYFQSFSCFFPWMSCSLLWFGAEWKYEIKNNKLEYDIQSIQASCIDCVTVTPKRLNQETPVHLVWSHYNTTKYSSRLRRGHHITSHFLVLIAPDWVYIILFLTMPSTGFPCPCLCQYLLSCSVNISSTRSVAASQSL